MNLRSAVVTLCGMLLAAAAVLWLFDREISGPWFRLGVQPEISSELERSMDDPEFGTADAKVHRLVADIAGNRLAAAFTDWIVDVLQPRLREMIAPAVVESVVAEQHRDMIQAIRRGDPTAAERAMREHLVYLSDLVTALAEPEGDGG